MFMSMAVFWGQHRGAYTRFVFDATDQLHPGDNTLAVRVDNDPKDYTDCLPSHNRLYTGMVVSTAKSGSSPRSWHIDPTDDASPGVYITPKNVSASATDFSIKVLLRNTSAQTQDGEVRATLLDPDGRAVKTLSAAASVPSDQRKSIELNGHPACANRSPAAPNLYHVKVEVLRAGSVVEET